MTATLETRALWLACRCITLDKTVLPGERDLAALEELAWQMHSAAQEREKLFYAMVDGQCAAPQADPPEQQESTAASDRQVKKNAILKTISDSFDIVDSGASELECAAVLLGTVPCGRERR